MLEIMRKFNLILQALLINPIVAEYDTPEGWHVRKYANGRAEATAEVITHPMSAGSAMGGVYTTNARIDLPKGLFVEPPKSKADCSFGNGVWSGPYTNFADYIVIALYRGAPLVTTWDVPVCVEVTGRWK